MKKKLFLLTQPFLIFLLLCWGFSATAENGTTLKLPTITTDTKQASTPSNDANGPQLNKPPTLIPPAPLVTAKAYVLMDANTGTIIASKNMNQRMPPASLTKLMTLYLASDAVKSGRVHLEDPVRISKNARQAQGSRMFLKEGSIVKLGDLIMGIIVASGNDACVATAEYIGGSEDTFVNLMNQTATLLGMKNSHFTDSTGMPDPQHYVTPLDMALLARALIKDFPQDYAWYKEKWITYNGIRQPNRNRLLWRDPSVDGLKTGHTEEAGYCLIASGLKNTMRLIVVLMGAPSDATRADETQALLNYGFRFYENHPLYPANTPLVTPRVWFGEKKQLSMGLGAPLSVTVANGQYSQLKATVVYDDPDMKAPYLLGKTYGQVQVTLEDKVVGSAPLVALENNPRAGAWSRIGDHITLLFRSWFSKKDRHTA